MDVRELVTVVIPSYGTPDLLRSVLETFSRFHPGTRVIVAEGLTDGADATYRVAKTYNAEFWMSGDLGNEDRRAMSVAAVTTPYVLFCDTDCKPIRPTAVPLMVQVMMDFPGCACTAAYCVKLVGARVGYCSTEFTGVIPVSYTSGYFQMHRVRAWKEVGGFPREAFWEGAPDPGPLEMEWAGWGGDVTIAKKYREAGWETLSPPCRLPVIHWTRGSWPVLGTAGEICNEPLKKWVEENVKMTYIEPLNEWPQYADGSKKPTVIYRG